MIVFSFLLFLQIVNIDYSNGSLEIMAYVSNDCIQFRHCVIEFFGFNRDSCHAVHALAQFLDVFWKCLLCMLEKDLVFLFLFHGFIYDIVFDFCI